MLCSAQVNRARGRESWRVEAIQLGGSKRESSMKVGSDHEQAYRASLRCVAAAHHDLARQGHSLAAVEAGVAVHRALVDHEAAIQTRCERALQE
jgi:hypothetical protein